MFKQKLCMILLVLFTVPIFVLGVQVDDPFPIKPGTEKWKSFTSHAQKVEVLQLKKHHLENMPTKRLVQVCLDYPMAAEIMAYNTPQEGIEAVTRQFNGLQELMKRNDAAIYLLQVYSNLNPAQMGDNWTMYQKGEFSARIRFVELLLAQDQVLTKLDTKQRHQLLKQSVQKFDSKMANQEAYGLLSLSTPALIMGKLLKQDSKERFAQIGENKKINLFLKTAQLAEPELLEQLVIEAKDSIER